MCVIIVDVKDVCHMCLSSFLKATERVVDYDKLKRLPCINYRTTTSPEKTCGLTSLSVMQATSMQMSHLHQSTSAIKRSLKKTILKNTFLIVLTLSHLRHRYSDPNSSLFHPELITVLWSATCSYKKSSVFQKAAAKILTKTVNVTILH